MQPAKALMYFIPMSSTTEMILFMIKEAFFHNFKLPGVIIRELQDSSLDIIITALKQLKGVMMEGKVTCAVA